MQRFLLVFKLWYACAGMNWSKKKSTSSWDSESSSKNSVGLRKGSDNANVCRLARRSHVRSAKSSDCA